MFQEYQSLLFTYVFGFISIFLLSLSAYIISNKYSIIINKKKSYFIFFLSFGFYITSILYLTFAKIGALNHYADFATHLEILWRNSKGLGLTTLMSEKYHGGSHWFAAHFTPIIYLTYVPAFSILQNAYVIPIFETLFITSSLIPLWLISKKYVNKDLSRLFISSFFFYPTIFYTNLYGIAYIELCMPLFLWLFYFFEEKKNKLFILTLILCLMIREEVSLVTCFFGIYILTKKKYALGCFTIILSLVYFYTVLFIVIPSFRAEGYHQLHIAESSYKQWGGTYSEMILNILLNPIDTLNKILIAPKIGNFAMILVPLLFLPLSNIFVFLIATPNLAMAFLSTSITHSSFILYYLSPSIPIFFYAAITGISKLKNFKFININSLVNAILVASISTTIFFGATPISIAFWNKDYSVGNFYTTNFHRGAYIEEDRDIFSKKLVKLIPDDAVVSAEQHFLPLLYKKKKMIAFPDEDKSIQYVLIDKLNPKKTGGFDGSYGTFRLKPEFYYQKYLKNSNWSIISENKGVILLKKKSTE
jgi:uncharacterized membrane protein